MGIITMRMNTPHLTNRQIVVAIILRDQMEALEIIYDLFPTEENEAKLVNATVSYQNFCKEKINAQR